MAEIIPLRAWRYADSLRYQLDDLTSPLFDVVSNKQRQKLYENPLNSIHLSVPKGDNHAMDAHDKVKEWKRDGILVQDALPGIYVYYQYFTLPGSNKEQCRKGFIANLRIYDWNEKVLLRHESTMSHSVEDRLDVLHATQMNISPTHGLYTDATHEIETYLDESMKSPLYETEDYQGVRDVLSVIHDAVIIKRIQQIIADKQIILADGHHRYEGSLLYMKQQRDSNPHHKGNEGYNYHMMYFTNTESDDLRILPTHRLVSGLSNFSSDDVLTKLSEYFTIRPIENVFDVNEIILGKPWAFGLIMGEQAYKIRLKDGLVEQIHWNFPPAIKALDLTVLHYYVIEKVLGISGKMQRDSRHLSFDRNFAECVNLASKGECQLALITQDISIETIKEVCYSGYTLPQKSTYFYPKVICGFLFGTIHPDEFSSMFDAEFR
jgi:uncharacterized protein (DUF1015 family)